MPPNHYSHPHAAQIPDPNDRTPNDPAVLVDSKYVKAHVKMYGSDFEKSGKSAQQFYCDLAEKEGWDATEIGASVLLRVYPTIIDPVTGPPHRVHG